MDPGEDATELKAPAAQPPKQRRQEKGFICSTLGTSGWMEKAILLTALVEDRQLELADDLCREFYGSDQFSDQMTSFRGRFGHNVQRWVPHPDDKGKGKGKGKSKDDKDKGKDRRHRRRSRSYGRKDRRARSASS